MTHQASLVTFERDDAPEWERPSGLVAVYAAAPRPFWTSEAPTHEGWFWVKPQEAEIGLPVRITRHPQSGALVWGSTDLPWRPVRMAGLMWSDRAIREPGEANRD